MKTAYQYIRISSEDQSNFSITGQQITNEEYARKYGIQIVRTFVDDGYSAKNFDRPAWRELEGTLTKNKVDFLIVMKYDRLIRNVVEGLTFVEKLEQKYNITLLSVMENFSIDPHSPYFFKSRADMFVNAEFERRVISDRTRFGVWSAKKQGRFIGIAPYGYQNSRDADDKPVIVVDPLESKIVQQVYKDFLNDISFAMIMDKARDQGLKLTGKDTLNRILTNQAYAGLIKTPLYKDDQPKVIKGLHEAIISEDIYWKSFYKMKERNRPASLKSFDENIPLRHFYQCENCGDPFTGAKCKGRKQYYYYYWCHSCRGKNFNANKVHEELGEILNGLSLNPKLLEALRAEAEIQLNESQSDRVDRLASIKREHVELKKKLDSLEEKYIDNKIDHPTYKKWHEQCTTDLNKKKILLTDLQRDDADIRKLFNTNLSYLSDLNWLYGKAVREYKQTFLKAVFPAGLTKLSRGVRTAFMEDIFLPNIASLKGLLTIKKDGDTSFLGNIPDGVRNGSNIEHLLRVIDVILKAA